MRIRTRGACVFLRLYMCIYSYQLHSLQPLLFAMVSIKQLVLPVLIFAALAFSTQGEHQKSLQFIKIITISCHFQARLQFQGEALFVWYATGCIFLHTPLDGCRYISPAGDTSVMMSILLARKPM